MHFNFVLCHDKPSFVVGDSTTYSSDAYGDDGDFYIQLPTLSVTYSEIGEHL